MDPEVMDDLKKVKDALHYPNEEIRKIMALVGEAYGRLKALDGRINFFGEEDKPCDISRI